MSLTFPNGPVQTKAPWGAFGIDWDRIARHGKQIEQAADEFGVEESRLAGTEVIESQGEEHAVQYNSSNGNSYGLVQVVPYGVGWKGWSQRVIDLAGLHRNASVKEVTEALFDPLTNLRVGASILRDFFNQHGSWDRASSAFFLGNPDWQGADTVNGNTGQKYKQSLIGLMSELAGSGGTVSTDVIDLLFGGKPYEISATYGQLVTWSCPGCYDYQAAYGLDTQHHYAYDVSANAGDGAPLYAPFDGTIVCTGTDMGQGAWGTGCAAFPRLNNYGSSQPNRWGSGRLELLHEDGHASLIMGHVLETVASGRVTAGTLIGYQGGMNGSHVHLEGRYANGSRIGDPRVLFGGGTTTVPKAERLDIPQPAEFDRTWTVTVTESDTPVLQRADPTASPVAEPLAAGEQFEAAYLTISDSTGEPYWVSKARGRVPARNTNLAEVLGIETGGKTDLTALRGKVSDLLHDADNYLTTAIDSALYAITEASN